MEDAREFLKELCGELKEGELIEIRSLSTGRTPNRMFMKSPDAAVTAAAGLAQSSDVVFGAATRDGRGGKKENIVRIPAVWVDLDSMSGNIGTSPNSSAATEDRDPKVLVYVNRRHAGEFLSSYHAIYGRGMTNPHRSSL